jgi:hypothetical protein
VLRSRVQGTRPRRPRPDRARCRPGVAVRRMRARGALQCGACARRSAPACAAAPARWALTSGSQAARSRKAARSRPA